MLLLATGPNGLQLVLLVIIGLLAGVLGGLLGIGGGLVMIPAMLLLIGEHAYGPDSLHLYKLAALVSAVLLSIAALRQHIRAGAIQPRVLEGAIPAGFVGVALGVLLAGLLSGDLTHVLRRIFGAFMILAVLLSLWMRRSTRAPEGAAAPPARSAGGRLRAAAIVGLPAGVVSGLLGVGGGVWAVPAQHALMGIGLRSAIANSAGLVLAQTAAAAVGMSLTVANMPALRVADGLWLALFLVPGALAGGGVGAALVHRLPVGAVRGVFYVVLVAAGLRLMLG
ncbi:MAG: TSUP family transporter [Phycisphaerae bacterium]|jgi:hypothetical protein